jgi:predicted RNase H-like HicB family nuclease
MQLSNYAIIIEPTDTGFSAYSPDLDGCITVGETVEQTKSNMEEAIELYLEELEEAV